MSQCYITHFASKSELIFSAIYVKTVPKQRGVSEIPHPCNSCCQPAALCTKTLPERYLYQDSDCDSYTCQFLVWSFLGGEVFLVCYITLWGGLEKCYTVYIFLKSTIFTLFDI